MSIPSSLPNCIQTEQNEPVSHQLKSDDQKSLQRVIKQIEKTQEASAKKNTAQQKLINLLFNEKKDEPTKNNLLAISKKENEKTKNLFESLKKIIS